MIYIIGFGEQIRTVRIELCHCGPEMIVYRCPLEYPLFDSFFLSFLEIFHLQDYRQVLYQEDSAKNRNQQFLVDDDGKYSNDTSDGQTARISHEYLCREGIVPKETDQCSDEGTDIDYQLLASRYIHDIQVAGIFNMARHVGQYSQRDSDDGRITRSHTVHTVIQVGSVGYRRYHKDGNQHEDNPSHRLCLVSHEANQVCIVKIVVLEERNRRLGRFLIVVLVHYVHNMSVLLYLHILPYHYIRTEIKRQSDNQSQSYLTDDLELSVQSFLVFPEYLDVVVQKAQCTQPDRSNQHQYHVYIMQFTQQQARNQYGYNDDDTSHGRHSHFSHIKRVDGCVTLRFRNLFPLQQVNEIFTENSGNQQRQDDSHQ